MAKLLKIVSRIIGITLEWTLLLVILFAFAIRTSKFQTFLGSVATEYLSKEMDAEFRIGKIDVIFFDKLLLKDVFVRDQKGDTLANLKAIDVVVQNINLSGNKLIIKNVSLFEGRIGIDRDTLTGDYNYWFITDYFDSGSSTKKKKQPMAVTIKSLDISSVDISYNDYRKTYSDFGMDYDHLFFKNVELHAKEFKTDGGVFSFYLAHLSTREKCGLSLRKLRTYCKIDQDRGIFLSDLSIQTSRSNLYSKKFYMRMSSLQNVHSFEDSVTFDARIDSSRASLRDISLFATALEGMDQYVAVSGTLKRKVKDLHIDGVDLRFGEKSVIQGDFILPDFRRLKGSPFRETVTYAFVSLKDVLALKLPKDAEQRFLSLDPMIEGLDYVEVRKTVIAGTTDEFNAMSKQITSKMGTVHIDNGLTFRSIQEGGYAFERTSNSNFDVYVDSFQLGKFINDDLFGKVNGSVFVSGIVGQSDVIRLTKLSGIINSFGFNNYRYTNIEVEDGSFISNVFDAKININDPHLKLSYSGKIDVNKNQKFDFQVAVKEADLGLLGFVDDPNAELLTKMKVNMTGTNLSNYSGDIHLDTIFFKEMGKPVLVPKLDASIVRGPTSDRFQVTSEIANIELVGKVNPATIETSVNNCISRLLPTYFTSKPLAKGQKDQNFFLLKVDTKKTDELLSLFFPELKIAENSVLVIDYDARNNKESISINSNELRYTEQVLNGEKPAIQFLKGFQLEQRFVNDSFGTELTAVDAQLNDSLYVKNLVFNSYKPTNQDPFLSVVKWNEGLQDPARFKFFTRFKPNNEIDLTLKPSEFSVKGQLWEIQNTADLVYAEQRISIDHLVLERDVQFIAINGVLSDREEDNVVLNINDLHMEEFSSFVDLGMDLKGKLNGNVKISTPFTSFKADGNLVANEVFINQQEIGDVFANGIWDDVKKRLVLDGKLNYLKNETFDFSGFFYPTREENNLDFYLTFKETDIQFANAFMDPDVLSDIRGKLKGEITVRGNTDNPKINGNLRLTNGNVKVGILGVNYKMSGPIVFDGENNGIYADLPVKDEEGNNAFINASVYHENFASWNMDLEFIFDERVRKAGETNQRLLVQNTQYKEGDVYYGKAYASGTATISLSERNTEITVYARTERGTKIDLPMYGPSDISEFDFITFTSDTVNVPNHKVNLTGVDLKLEITATPDANVKLIFNEKTGDEMVANGSGILTITADNFGQIKMDGTYTINEGNYNFVMGPVRQEFALSQGGSIAWHGNPYDADLNLRTTKSVNASLSELTGDAINGTSNNNKQPVLCILDITEKLSKPLITLDIDVPNINESGKTVLAGIKANNDDLQKQFFTLLVLKRFAPIGQNNSQQSFGGIADVLTEQINAALDQMSKDVKFNVGYDGNAYTGDKNYEFGMRTALGENEKIVLKGNFGVANSASDGSTGNSLIGDASIDYLINEDGTFRITIFQESNEKGVLANKDKGADTQGIGIHYQEDFNTARESKIIQFLANIFRRKSRDVKKKNNRKVPLPSAPQAPLPPAVEIPKDSLS